MTQERPELTDRIMNIPMALARKYAEPGTDRYDDLVCEGNLAMVEAVTRWEEGKGTLLSSFVYAAVNYRLLRVTGRSERGGHYYRWNGMQELPEDLMDTRSQNRQPGEDLESKEVVDRMVRKLRPLQRAVFLMTHSQNLSTHQIAQRLSRSQSWVRWMLKQIDKRLTAMRRVIGRDFSYVHKLRNNKPIKANPDKIKKGLRERKQMLLATGELPKADYYLVNHEQKTVHSQNRYGHQLVVQMGVTCPVVRGPHAYRIYNERLKAAGYALEIRKGSDCRLLCQKGYRHVMDLPPRKDVNHAKDRPVTGQHEECCEDLHQALHQAGFPEPPSSCPAQAG